jgi:hypothetical protein
MSEHKKWYRGETRMKRYVEREDAGWSDPKNIGPPVNSDVNEYYVSLTKDGTIYFASNRASGLGSFDIYRSRLV